jgi:hypothetical protein
MKANHSDSGLVVNGDFSGCGHVIEADSFGWEVVTKVDCSARGGMIVVDSSP